MKQHVFCLFSVAVIGITSCKKGGSETPPDPDPPKTEQQNIAGVDDVMTSFMSKYSIPGGQIAIVKNEKLVYLKSYGQAGPSDNTAVTNANLFRVASVSKPITGVGIMKLLEANKLTLDSKVFGAGSILGSDYPSTNLAAVSDITVRQLLHHSSGAWPNDATDPMFKQPTYTQAQLIKWVLDTYPAGARNTYKYSNFGYCLLGRIIEKLSGKTYEQYIKDEVLTPSGISSMQIAGNTMADRKPNEVLYAPQGGYNAYSDNVTRMDSHGGWIASAKDLAKFIVHVDGFASKTDILKPATIAQMTNRSIPSSLYACGWQVNDANIWWHIGGIPGTASEIVRTSNGLTWVLLFNSRSVAASFGSDLDNIGWTISGNTAIKWQDIDQF